MDAALNNLDEQLKHKVVAQLQDKWPFDLASLFTSFVQRTTISEDELRQKKMPIIDDFQEKMVEIERDLVLLIPPSENITEVRKIRCKRIGKLILTKKAWESIRMPMHIFCSKWNTAVQKCKDDACKAGVAAASRAFQEKVGVPKAAQDIFLREPYSAERENFVTFTVTASDIKTAETYLVKGESPPARTGGIGAKVTSGPTSTLTEEEVKTKVDKWILFWKRTAVDPSQIEYRIKASEGPNDQQILEAFRAAVLASTGGRALHHVRSKYQHHVI
jgi:hypothetical protein